ncbi:MAG: aminotransferase class III-fold pyridoxal phosphate-dependent enzyme [Alphaproteobacteria bacterium]
MLSKAERDHWQGLLATDYGIIADLYRLDGEFDLNVAIEVKGEVRWVLKIMRPDCCAGLVKMQIAALDHVRDADPDLPVPRIEKSAGGADSVIWPDREGKRRIVWLITALPGMPYGVLQPHTSTLMEQTGGVLARLTKALVKFEHTALERDFKWHPLRPQWAKAHIDLVQDEANRTFIKYIFQYFESECEGILLSLGQTPIHCDGNDYNLLALPSLTGPVCSGVIDFGDMTRAPAICDLATAAAYLVLGQCRPLDMLCALVRGYHSVHPFSKAELALLYPLLLTRLAVSLVNAAMMKQKSPDDPYVTISEAPALAFLNEARDWPIAMVTRRLHLAAGFPVVDHAGRVLTWLDDRHDDFAPIFATDFSGDLPGDSSFWPRCSCSLADSVLPENPTAISLDEAQTLVPAAIGTPTPHVGYYAEPRLVYTEPAFLTGAHPLEGRRTIHLGIDVFAPAGSQIAPPLEATVVATANRQERLDYGGVVILKHQTEAGDVFFSLYGHLDPDSITNLRPGQRLSAGMVFANLGAAEVNGGWQPHLHLQLGLALAGYDDERDFDWPGAADPDDLDYQLALYPNPAPLLGLFGKSTLYPQIDEGEVHAARRASFGGNLKLSYERPVMLMRGWRHYLYDEYGRTYLDAYNNVPHVGHAHPRLRDIASRQLGLINTNTRYLHPAQIDFAAALKKRLPEHLTHCYFVTSGSEANELALRLARAYTGARGMIVQEHGYHGHTTGTIDISPYKFNGPGGGGAPDWVETVEVADSYRGRFGYDDAAAGPSYAASVDGALTALGDRGYQLCGFIAESYPSVGGQIEPPAGYLAAVYEKVRAAGGVCIADEVQTGLGRLGDAYWGFATQNAVPDMVVLGKPVGNGHPIGVVVTTAAIANSFANGMEFFSTFGGTTLACLIGAEVLQIVDDEGLQANAAKTGAQLLAGFRTLQSRYDLIGDVRGRGLFLGVELVCDRQTKAPATALAGYVANRMREHRILIGTDGPFDNVLKIRPPLTIDGDDCEMLLNRLDQVLAEAQLINQAG